MKSKKKRVIVWMMHCFRIKNYPLTVGHSRGSMGQTSATKHAKHRHSHARSLGVQSAHACCTFIRVSLLFTGCDGALSSHPAFFHSPSARRHPRPHYRGRNRLMHVHPTFNRKFVGGRTNLQFSSSKEVRENPMINRYTFVLMAIRFFKRLTCEGIINSTIFYFTIFLFTFLN